MTKELKPIDVSKYTVTESGNVIRTDNTETLKNVLNRIAELEKEIKNLKLLHSYDVRVLESKNEKAKEIIKGILPYTTFTFDEETDFYLKKYYKQAEDFIKE